jgi:hypothetical protein
MYVMNIFGKSLPRPLRVAQAIPIATQRTQGLRTFIPVLEEVLVVTPCGIVNGYQYFV